MPKKHLDFKRMLDDTDFSDPSSIERYAANLDGMTFRDILELGIAPEGESAPKDFGSKKYGEPLRLHRRQPAQVSQ